MEKNILIVVLFVVIGATLGSAGITAKNWRFWVITLSAAALAILGAFK